MIYSVKSGDTLVSISKQFNVPLKRLIVTNEIYDPNKISTGDILIIPDEFDNPFSLEIVLKDKVLKLIKDNYVYKQYPVAIGKAATPTPKGSWSIVKKGLWGEQFGGFFMQLNVPWGTYGIHGTNKPWSIGTRASHGCIRMFSDQAEELYAIIPLQTPVLIY